MRLESIVRTSAAVTETRSRLAKIALLAGMLRELRPDEVPVAVAYLSGELPQGAIGVGWASLRDLPPPAPEPSLQLIEADAAVSRTAGVKASQVRRAAMLSGDLGVVAAALAAQGPTGLGHFRLTVLRPIQ